MKKILSQVPVIIALGRLGQEDFCEFKAIQIYRMSSRSAWVIQLDCLKKKKRPKKNQKTKTNTKNPNLRKKKKKRFLVYSILFQGI